VERVQDTFKQSLQHLASNCNIDIRYHSSASKDQPFYGVYFYLQFVYQKKLTNEPWPRKEFRPDIEIIGSFMESHPVETLANYINKLLSIPTLEELRDYRIIRTRHQILNDTSIVPIWEEVLDCSATVK
jgi:hypothetical protein